MGASISVAGYVHAALLLRKLLAQIMNNISRASGNYEVWTLERLHTTIEQEMKYLRAVEEPENPASSFIDQAPCGTIAETLCGTVMVAHGNLQCLLKASYIQSPRMQVKITLAKQMRSKLVVKNMSVMSKRECIDEPKVCYNCLRNNHKIRDCRVRNSFTKCGHRHHSTICDKNTSVEYSVNVSFKAGDNTFASNETEYSFTIQETNLSMHPETIE